MELRMDLMIESKDIYTSVIAYFINTMNETKITFGFSFR